MSLHSAPCNLKEESTSELPDSRWNITPKTRPVNSDLLNTAVQCGIWSCCKLEMEHIDGTESAQSIESVVLGSNFSCNYKFFTRHRKPHHEVKVTVP